MNGPDAKRPSLSRRMSGADAAFLYLERKEIPLNIASVAVFDSAIPFEEFVEAIDSKLHLVPRYLQIPVAPLLNIGHPTWEYDAHFDIRRHILQVRLDAPGGDAELETLAGRILSRLMDRNKPLWDIHVVDGLAHGRGALIVRVHHALADGVSGVALLKVMLDPTPEGSRAVRKPRFRPEAAAPEDSLPYALGGAVQSMLENLLAAEVGILDFVQSLLSGTGRQGLQGFAGLLPELAASVERLPFNKPCGSDRRFCWTEFDLGKVQAIRAAVACGTVNDVMLAVVTRAVAKYARLHRETVAGRFLRVVCPVSLRRGDQGEAMGNRISFLPVALPMDVNDPVQLLRMVAARTEIMKSARAADVVALAGTWLAAAPAPVQAAFWQTLPYITFPLPLLNLICTNVPGSPAPLYAAGKRMIASYPQVPTGYELGVGCAVQSYAGKLCFGLTSDFQAAPDAHRLRDFVEVSFRELCRAAGVEQAAPRRESAAAKGRKPAAAVRAKPRKQKTEPAPVAAKAPPQRERTPAPARPESPLVPTAAGQRKRKGKPAPAVRVPPAVPATAEAAVPAAATEPLAKSTVA